MIYFIDAIIIVLLFSLFAISHSLLASFNFKEKLVAKIGNRIAFYRFFYNVISIISFTAIYFLAPKPHLIIYDLNYPYDIIIFSIQILGVIGFFWSVSYIDVKEFLGLKQIIRFYNGSYNLNNIDEQSEFIVKGPFKLLRHPIYFFSIIILGFRPTMDFFYLVFFICSVLYFYIGSIHEEKNLEKKFGEKYLVYKKSTPRLIPFLF